MSIINRLLFALMLLAAPAAHAGQASTVMPDSGPMSLGTFVDSFLNPGLRALYTNNAGSASPVNGIGGLPEGGACWWDTSASPIWTYRCYDGAQWVPGFTLDTVGHTFSVSQSSPVKSATGSGYTFLDSDRGKMVDLCNATTVTATLPQINTAGAFLSGWYVTVRNKCAGTVNLTPAVSTIDGAASVPLITGESVVVRAAPSTYETDLPQQPFDQDLTTIAALTGTGFTSRVSSSVWAQRTMTGTANEICATNGDGISGNPTFALCTALTFTGKTVTGGTFAGLTSLGVGPAQSSASAFVSVASTSTSSEMSVGQATNYLSFLWSYNATPSSAQANIATAGYANPITIDASILTLQGLSGGTLKFGANTVTLGGALTTGGAFSTAAAFTMSGAFGFTGTLTGTTAVTFPTAGTLLSSTSAAGGDLTGTYPNPTIASAAVTYAKIQNVSSGRLLGNSGGSPASINEISLGATLPFIGPAIQTAAGTGDVSWPANSFVTTLATVNSNVGSFGSSTAIPNFTVNAKGQVTAVSTSAVVAPASTLTGLGTGVAAGLAAAVNGASGFVTFSGALGTPTSGVATNLTGTAAGLTAGNVTTNANLTGDVTSVGNATTLTNAPVIAKVLTGFASTTGTITSADSILTAMQKLYGNDALKAPLASPTFTGTPAAPTAAPGTNTTQVASTAFVTAAVAASTSGVASFNALTGTVTTNIVTQSFTTPGTSTYTPTAGMLHAIIECVGAGGGGGGSAGSLAQVFSGAGGGSGGYSRKLVTAADIGASKTVTIPSGAAGGSGGANTGGTGSTASVGSLCIANGGIGGTGGSGAVGPSAVAGGAAGTGDLTAPGNPGQSGLYNTVNGGILVGLGGGGNSMFGAGGIPTSPFGTASGNNAIGCGGGGSGALTNNTTGTANGGGGGNGCVFITEFINL